MLIIRLFFIFSIVSSLFYYFLDYPSPVLLGFDLKTSSTNSVLYGLLLFFIPYIILEYIFRRRYFIKNQNIYLKNFLYFNKTLRITSFFFCILIFLCIFYFTFILYIFDMREVNLQSRILKSKLMFVLYPLYGITLFYLFINSRTIFSKSFFFLMSLCSCILVAYIESSRDFILIISPFLFGLILNLNLKNFLFFTLTVSNLLICFYGDFYNRTSGNFIWLVTDAIFYVSGYNVLYLSQLIHNNFQCTFSFIDFLLLIQPFPVSLIHPNYVYELYDPVRPVPGIYQIYNLGIHFVIIFYLVCLNLFRYLFIRLKFSSILSPIILILFFISLFQYNLRQSIRVLHLILFLLLLTHIYFLLKKIYFKKSA